MSTILDIIGASVITGFLILMTISFTSRINSVTQDSLATEVTLNSASNTAQIFEFYFYKIGSMTMSDIISVADSDKIRFDGDIDEDGIVEDFLLYNYTVDDWTYTENPNDSPVYSRTNSGDNNLVAVVTDFHLTYYDAMQNELAYSILDTSQTLRNTIRSIKVFIKSESSFPVDSIYEAVVWERLISPRNLINN